MKQDGDTIRIDMLVIPPFYENTYVLSREDKSRVVIIDPGDDADAILRLLKENNKTPDIILLTHGHMDHIGGISRVKDAFPDVRIGLHPDDLPLYRSLPEQPSWLGLDTQYTIPPEPDLDLEHEQILTLAGIEIKVIHTPGHTPGSCCFLVDDNLFTGDTLFQGSIGRTDLPGGSYSDIIRSIMTRIVPLGDHITVYPGHGPSSTIGKERLSNPFLQVPYVPL